MAEKIIAPNVSLVNGNPATTSLAIAECFGKQHAHVLRDIEKLIAECPQDFGRSNFGLSSMQPRFGGVFRSSYNPHLRGCFRTDSGIGRRLLRRFRCHWHGVRLFSLGKQWKADINIAAI